jgi:hypothetical protein
MNLKTQLIFKHYPQILTLNFTLKSTNIYQHGKFILKHNRKI